MSYKQSPFPMQQGTSSHASALKQSEECYIDEDGKKVCPMKRQSELAQELTLRKEKKEKEEKEKEEKEKVYQGGELPEVTIKG